MFAKEEEPTHAVKPLNALKYYQQVHRMNICFETFLNQWMM